MKNLVGQNVVVRADGQTIKGRLIKDMKERVILQGNDEEGTVMTIIKNKISMFFAKGGKGIPTLSVLACSNPEINCKGVKYIKEGEVKEKDYGVFMHDCPARTSECLHGDLGNIFQVDDKTLTEMFKNTLFGDYPEGE
jgi:hypothetical protein